MNARRISLTGRKSLFTDSTSGFYIPNRLYARILTVVQWRIREGLAKCMVDPYVMLDRWISVMGRKTNVCDARVSQTHFAALLVAPRRRGFDSVLNRGE